MYNTCFAQQDISFHSASRTNQSDTAHNNNRRLYEEEYPQGGAKSALKVRPHGASRQYHVEYYKLGMVDYMFSSTTCFRERVLNASTTYIRWPATGVRTSALLSCPALFSTFIALKAIRLLDY